MKKTMIFAIAVLLTAAGSYFVFAKEQTVSSRDANSDMKVQKQCCDKVIICGQTAEMCPIHLMTAQSLMQRQIVTPTDGGVIILAGNKLLKYDKDLKFLKETELKIDMEKTQKEIKKIMKSCPECRETQR